MAIQEHSRQDVLDMLKVVKDKLHDPMVVSEIQNAKSDHPPDERLTFLSSQLSDALACVSSEEHYEGEAFHSRHPLAGLCQSHLSEVFNSAHVEPGTLTHSSFGDDIPAVANLQGEGSIFWAPVMVNILIDHLRPKADFVTATNEKSLIEIPDNCVIAILGDWGADNDHAQRIARYVLERKPNVAIHLGAC